MYYPEIWAAILPIWQAVSNDPDDKWKLQGEMSMGEGQRRKFRARGLAMVFFFSPLIF